MIKQLIFDFFFAFGLKSYKSKFISFTLGVVFLLAGEVWAGQVNWVGGITGNWEEPANWSSELLPGAGDDVIVDIGQPVTIVHGTGETVIGSLSMLGTLYMQGGAITVTGSASIDGELTMIAGTALIADGMESRIIVIGAANIGSGNISAFNGGHITLPGATRYQGGGWLYAEGAGSVLELKNLSSIGIGQPEPIDSLFDAISREYSGYHMPQVIVDEETLDIFEVYSREVTVYHKQDSPAQGFEKGILEVYSREVSVYLGGSSTQEGPEKGIFEIYSREVSGYRNPFTSQEGPEKGILEIYSREISTYHRTPGLNDEPEKVVTEAVSREVSLEHLALPE